MADPPLASLRELQDGTYSIDDLADMHEGLDVKEETHARLRAKKD